MTDIVERLRRLSPSPSAYGEREAAAMNESERREAADEIERLRLALRRIESINDDPLIYNAEIYVVLTIALRPRKD